MTFWHVSELTLSPGSRIEPGRWGALTAAAGQGDQFFFREMLLELWRLQHTRVAVSRLNCVFAFEDRSAAEGYAGTGHQIYEVALVDESAARARLDMLWLTWLGQANSSFDATVSRCQSYWDGRPTSAVASHANSTWEWLFASALEVV